MKKRITKIWGVGLIVVLLASLFVVAIPTSAADPLQYNSGGALMPGGYPFYRLAATSDVYDFAIASDGATIYAVGKTATDNSTLWKSANGGRTWTINTATTFTANHTDLVAIAPDDPNVVVVVDTTSGGATNAAFYSADGGVRWSNLGTPEDYAGNDANMIYDVDISPSVFGTRYVVCSGQETGGADADGAALYIYNVGAVAPDWINACDAEGFWTALADTEVDSIQAFEFSPSFLSDSSALAVTEREGVAGSENGTIALNFVNFNTFKWNTLDSYPVTIQSSTLNTVLTCEAADLVLAPDYMGGDEVMRVSFVGLAATGSTGEVGGVFRFMDIIKKEMLAAAAGIYSVDFNGSALVAGQLLSNNIYRCADPLTTIPTVLPATSYKRIGVNDDAGAAVDVTNDYTQVAFSGENVYGAKRGAGSAFAISYDSGKSWNDISLIDIDAAYDIGDFWVSADASTKYFTANDTGETSLFRYKDGAWERVLCLDDSAQNIVRVAPDNSDVVYVAAVGGTTMYYTADAGQTRWYPRAMSAANDVAVESANIVYVASGGNIVKSVNNGFIWGLPVDAFPTASDNVMSLRTMGENKLLAAGSAGAVGYSTDGGATWSQTLLGATSGGNAVVTASGLEAGDYLYAVTDGTLPTTGVVVSRIQIGTDIFWKDVTVGTANFTGYGIELVGSTLYVLACNTVTGDTAILRTLLPTVTVPDAVWWNVIDDGTATLTTSQRPPIFEISSGSNWLWMVDIAGGTSGEDALYYYEDTLATAGPTLTAPADGTLVQMNAASGAVYNVPLQWNRLSLTTAYTVYLALDSALTQLVTTPIPVSASTPTASYIINAGTVGLLPGTTYYWAVASSSPISSPRSETRSFTVQPTAASVPAIGSPENGGVIDSENPAFSWSPVGGATMYEFQLSVGTAFIAPLYTETLANTGIQPPVTLEPGTTYFWRVRALSPVQGDWSAIANFTVAEEEPPAPEPTPPVVVETTPAPVIEIPAAPPAQEVILQPPAEETIAPAYIWAIIIIGAVLVIAVIVLIVRTRRSV